MPFLRAGSRTQDGGMLASNQKNVGGKGSKAPGAKREPLTDETPTLADMGIFKKESSDAKRLAADSERNYHVSNERPATRGEQTRRRIEDARAVIQFNESPQSEELGKVVRYREDQPVHPLPVEGEHGRRSGQALPANLAAKLERIFGARIILLESQDGRWKRRRRRRTPANLSFPGERPAQAIHKKEGMTKKPLDPFTQSHNKLVRMLSNLRSHFTPLELIEKTIQNSRRPETTPTPPKPKSGTSLKPGS